MRESTVSSGRPRFWTCPRRTLMLVTPPSVMRTQCIRLRLMAHMCMTSGLPPPAKSSSSTAKVTMPRIAGKRFTSSGARFGRA